MLLRTSNGPQGPGQEGQRWPQAEGLVGSKQNSLGSLWDPMENESVGPLFKNNEEFLTGQLQSVKPSAGPSKHRAPVAAAAQAACDRPWGRGSPVGEVFKLLCKRTPKG